MFEAGVRSRAPRSAAIMARISRGPQLRARSEADAGGQNTRFAPARESAGAARRQRCATGSVPVRRLALAGSLVGAAVLLGGTGGLRRARGRELQQRDLGLLVEVLHAVLAAELDQLRAVEHLDRLVAQVLVADRAL